MTWQTNDWVTFESALLGKVLTEVSVDDEQITFTTDRGERYVQHHEQDCCESVYVEDVIGNIDDVIGSPILLAEEVTNSGEEDFGTFTWTFYKLATIKGDITIRWYGSSNGYYSERVTFESLESSEIH